MFLYEDGTVTGSIVWAQLREVVAARSDENVSDEGWTRLEALVAAHDGTTPEAAPDEQAEEEPAETEADPEPSKAELQEQLRERGLPTTGNKAELQERLAEADSQEP